MKKTKWMTGALTWVMAGLLLGALPAQAGESRKQDTSAFNDAWSKGNDAFEHGKFVEAISHYRKALTVKPKHARARFSLANAYREVNRHYEARRNYRLALSARPGEDRWEAQCRLSIAESWEAQKHYREALLEYQLALVADPDMAAARDGRKRLLALEGR